MKRKMKDAVAEIKKQAEREAESRKWREDYAKMIGLAAEIATSHARALAMQGIVAPLRLYYKKGAFGLQSEAISYDMAADGWIATNRLLPMNIPYTGYANWIRNNSSDLEVL